MTENIQCGVTPEVAKERSKPLTLDAAQANLDLANKDIEVYNAELERMDATIKQLVEALLQWDKILDTVYNNCAMDGEDLERLFTPIVKQALSNIPEELRG